MNELEKKLLEVLEKSISLAEQTGKFVIDQAPELLQEFYRWQILKSIVIFLICIALFSFAQKVHLLFSKKDLEESDKKKNYRAYKGRYYKTTYSGDPDSDALTFTLVVKFLSYSLIIPICLQIYKILFITIAPKMYLVQYILNIQN